MAPASQAYKSDLRSKASKASAPKTPQCHPRLSEPSTSRRAARAPEMAWPGWLGWPELSESFRALPLCSVSLSFFLSPGLWCRGFAFLFLSPGLWCRGLTPSLSLSLSVPLLSLLSPSLLFIFGAPLRELGQLLQRAVELRLALLSAQA